MRGEGEHSSSGRSLWCVPREGPGKMRDGARLEEHHICERGTMPFTTSVSKLQEHLVYVAVVKKTQVTFHTDEHNRCGNRNITVCCKGLGEVLGDFASMERASERNDGGERREVFPLDF